MLRPAKRVQSTKHIGNPCTRSCECHVKYIGLFQTQIKPNVSLSSARLTNRTFASFDNNNSFKKLIRHVIRSYLKRVYYITSPCAQSSVLENTSYRCTLQHRCFLPPPGVCALIQIDDFEKHSCWSIETSETNKNHDN